MRIVKSRWSQVIAPAILFGDICMMALAGWIATIAWDESIGQNVFSLWILAKVLAVLSLGVIIAGFCLMFTKMLAKE